MSIRSIVTFVSDVQRDRHPLHLCVDVARRFAAHLSIVFIKPRVDFPPGMIGRSASLAYLEDIAEEAARASSEGAQLAKEICGGLPAWSWHEAEAEAEVLAARFTNLADLVVMAQHRREEGGGRELITPDELVAEAGCPMLLLPSGWTSETLGSRVLIAWQNGREAIHAVRGALSFLVSAKNVWVLADSEDAFADPPGSDLIAYLACHGIHAELVGAAYDGGDSILENAGKLGADLVVMGAFGHWRPRKLLFGGATRAVLHETAVPVFLQH